jgi:hypothetical protein
MSDASWEDGAQYTVAPGAEFSGTAYTDVRMWRTFEPVPIQQVKDYLIEQYRYSTNPNCYKEAYTSHRAEWTRTQGGFVFGLTNFTRPLYDIADCGHFNVESYLRLEGGWPTWCSGDPGSENPYYEMSPHKIELTFTTSNQRYALFWQMYYSNALTCPVYVDFRQDHV